jgi:hypothetical protein
MNASTLAPLLLFLGLGGSACWVFTHDPSAPSVGTTTTTAAELGDAGARPPVGPRTAPPAKRTSSDKFDLSQDSR